MVIYEVNHLGIRPDIDRQYRRWLHRHAREMLGLPGFVGVDWFACEDMTWASPSQGVCVHYHVRGPQDLERYLREEAPRMRADGVLRFPDGSRITRRLLRPRRSPLTHGLRPDGE
jgi:hypothetical protein